MRSMENTTYIGLFEKYLKGNAEPEEVKRLVEWLKSNDFEDWTVRQWEESIGLSADFDSRRRRDLLDRIKREIGISASVSPEQHVLVSRRLSLRVMKVAATILLLLSVGVAAYWLEGNQPDRTDLSVSAPKGQKARMVLPDGSEVWLNAASQIVCGNHFNQKERLVYLEGEAYFKVAKDTKRPFIVQTKDVKVKVHGTTFNVNTYDETETEVTLLEGAVELMTETNPSLHLKPNEKGVYNRQTNQLTMEATDAAFAIDWTMNRIRFRDESLASIMRRLERCFDIEVTISNDSLGKKRFTGDFSRNETIEQLFDVMSSNHNFNYSIKGNAIEIY